MKRIGSSISKPAERVSLFSDRHLAYGCRRPIMVLAWLSGGCSLPENTIDLKHPRRFDVGGQWVEPSSQSTFDVLNCSTEEVVAQVAEAKSADARRAVDAARHAFDEGPWPRMTHAERATYHDMIA